MHISESHRKWDETDVMSFNINWDTIYTDSALKQSLKDFLNEKLSGIDMPKYMDSLQIVEVDLGSNSPELTIRDVDYPFAEFYGEESNGENQSGSTEHSGQTSIHSKLSNKSRTNLQSSSSSASPPAPPVGQRRRLGSPIPISSTAGILIPRPGSPHFQGLHNGVGIGAFGMKENDNNNRQFESESSRIGENMMENNESDDSENEEELLKRGKNDIQLTLDLEWHSNIYIEVTCNLMVNYPAPHFITLPVRLKITDLQIHSLGVLAYLDHRLFISFLCDLDDEKSNSTSVDAHSRSRNSSVSESGGFQNPDDYNFDTGNRMDIIKDLKIEGELGDYNEIPEGPEGLRDAAKRNEDKIKHPNYKDKPRRLSSVENHHHMFSSSLKEGERVSLADLGPPMTLNEENAIADNSPNGSVLRNIGKIEKFLVSALRKMMVKELAWPSWIEIDMEDEEDDGSVATEKNE